MKKTISLIFVLAMCIGVLSVSVFSDDFTAENNEKITVVGQNNKEAENSRNIVASGFQNDSLWNLYDDGELEIIGTGVIGESYHENNNFEWSSYSDSIVSITIGEGITSLGGGIFENLGSSALRVGADSLKMDEKCR